MSENELWRSLDQKQGEPSQTARWNPFHNDFLSRRDFMEWSGGVMAVLGLASCTRQPNEKLIPYTKQPERIIPGKPLFYASALSVGGPALGVLVESHMGRPTKIEGNPEHPGSLGGTDVFSQAAILSLYDPDRSKVLLSGSQVTFWKFFKARMEEALAEQSSKQGAGLRLLTEVVTSPSLAAEIRKLLSKYPKAKWVQYEPINRDNELAGLEQAFGRAVAPVYRFDKAQTVVSLDSDVFGQPGAARYMRDFYSKRSLLKGRRKMSRLFDAHCVPNITSSMADESIPVRAKQVEVLAAAIAQGLGLSVGGKPSLDSAQQAWVDAIVAEVKAHPGASVFVAGAWQSAFVHAVAASLNTRFGAESVSYTEPVEEEAQNQSAALGELVAEMGSGSVDMLVVLGSNPVYSAPADVGFAQALEKVKLKVHSGMYRDETAVLCDWHVPQTHSLEAWGDLKAYDGTVSIQQPMIDPLFGGKSAIEVVGTLNGSGDKGYDLVRGFWKPSLSSDSAWRKAVHDGVVPQSASRTLSIKGANGSDWKWEAPSGELDVVFRPDPTLWDGRFANNGWLQECPKPLTRLTWDNVAMVNPKMAAKLGLKSESVIEIKVGEDLLEVPVWVAPGQADGSIGLQLGFGRKLAGRVGKDVGVNVYPLRTLASLWTREGASLRNTGKTYSLACTQDHWAMEGRDPVKRNSLAAFIKDSHWAEDHHHGPPIVQQVDVGTAGGANAPIGPADYQWGMSINLSACNGCNACVVACQSENNVPVVGKVEVERGREMHWLRIDRYFEGDLENPKVHNQPVACMQCETAPCEVVCPVGATVHDNEGLNNMVYNRCVGTKYCSNNCPYKVRRFNFFEYSDMHTPELKLTRNPDVTVRSRGVMEKCTYCVQRISAGRNQAKNAGRKIQDGEVKTACQTACPSQAIVFGDISDPNSLVSLLKEEPLNYSLLGVLNTKPRTTYLAKVTNPVLAHSGMEAKDEHEGSH